MLNTIKTAGDGVAIEWAEGERGDAIRYASWEQDGFTIRAEAIPDDDYMGEDFLGRLAYRDEPGRVRFAALGLESELRRAAAYQGWSARDWPTGYIPSENYPEDTPENREYWKQDAAQLLGLLAYDWQFLGVRVKAYRADVELGEDSIWGVCSTDSEHVDECARDCANAAVSMARRKLAALCAS